MIYHTGHRTSPDHKRRRMGAEHPMRAAAPFPPGYALRAFMGPNFDQGETETCYGHAEASLIIVGTSAAGTPLLWVPGPFGIVRNALSEEQPTGLLQDTGADMVDVMTATAREGVAAMGALAPGGRYSDVVPYAPGTGWARSTMLQDEQSSRVLVLGAEQLSPLAPDFVPQLCTGVANMRCGTSCGINATPPFQNWRAGMPALDDTSGATETDGHDVALLDYRTNPATGLIELWLLSSWSKAFGEDGGAWVTARWLVARCLEAWRLPVTLKAATS